MENIYKISHFYDKNHDESCFFIKTELDEVEMVIILATIQFKFGDLVGIEKDFESKKMITLLERFYPIKDVTEEYKPFIKYTTLKEEEWELLNHFTIGDQTITQIDLYEARECCCGDVYYKLMKQELPNSKEYIEEIMLLK